MTNNILSATLARADGRGHPPHLALALAHLRSPRLLSPSLPFLKNFMHSYDSSLLLPCLSSEFATINDRAKLIDIPMQHLSSSLEKAAEAHPRVVGPMCSGVIPITTFEKALRTLISFFVEYCRGDTEPSSCYYALIVL